MLPLIDLSSDCHTIYEVWQKSNETDFSFTKILFFFKHECYPLQNSFLRQLHTDGEVGSSTGNLQPVWSSTCPLHSLGYCLNSQNDVLEDIFQFTKKVKFAGAEVSGE